MALTLDFGTFLASSDVLLTNSGRGSGTRREPIDPELAGLGLSEQLVPLPWQPEEVSVWGHALRWETELP